MLNQVAQATGSNFEVVYSCPNSACRELFIAYFTHPQTAGPFILDAVRSSESIKIVFKEPVNAVSPSFLHYIPRSTKAEVLGLKQICGMGYRKALEFLIKDYLIKNHANREGEIKRTMLAPCIERYVTDQKIKDVAKRAAWLGNDETHYERRWVDKDLADLKVMIRLVIYWIEAEMLTAEALTSMPDPRGPEKAE